MPGTRPPDSADPLVLPLAREQVHVGVRRVDTGRGVRVHKTVSAQEQRIEQTLQRDSVTVTRVPIDRVVPLSEAPQPRQEGATWIVPVLEEVLVVEKRLRIKEELHITRTAHAESYCDSVVLRSEQVAIERFDESAGASQPSFGGSHHGAHTLGGI